MTPSIDVIIVGAGIAGLAAAVTLAQQGLACAVIEAGNAPSDIQDGNELNHWDRRVSALTPASQGLLDRVGVWSSMARRRISPYDRMAVWDGQGTGEITFSASELAVEQLGHIVENRVTVHALLQAAEADRRITLLWGDPIRALDARGAEAVTVVTEAGSEFSAPLLIGADGARSFVREQLGFQTRTWSYHQRALVATIALATPHQHTCYQAFLPTGPLALLPLAEPTLCSIVWSIDESCWEHYAVLDESHFVAALNRALGGRAPEVIACGERAAFPLRQCHAVDYIKPRVALVADAAHAIHPLAGQGINLGLADVNVLAEEVGRAFTSDLDVGAPEVLRRYQRRRKGENLAMMAAMEGFKRGFGSANPLLSIARNAGLKWVDELTPIKRWLAAQALA